jgi:hypothetical protein
MTTSYVNKTGLGKEVAVKLIVPVTISKLVFAVTFPHVHPVGTNGAHQKEARIEPAG